MGTELIQWAVSAGTATVILAFIGIVAWRIVFGSKTRKGLLDKWEDRRSKHEEEQTAMRTDDQAAVARSEKSDRERRESLLLLTQAQEPPRGPAYIAQEQINKTAITVDQLKLMGTEFTSIIRLLASQWPAVLEDINKHCEVIEQEVKRSTEDLLREQKRTREI